jgi:hypothetical protein
MIAQQPLYAGKSGKGLSHGNISELTAFFHVIPGHEQQLAEACQRFVTGLRNAGPEVFQKTGLRDMRHAIFDGGTRLLWITAFETEWDPYIDDSIALMGIQTWADWLQHTVEYNQSLLTASNADVKRWLQSGQVQATSYFNSLAALTLAEITKGQRVKQAFEQVLDAPAAEEALAQPVLAPLLAEAAD